MRLKISPLLVFLFFLLMSSNLILFLAGNSPIYAWEPTCKDTQEKCDPSWGCEQEIEMECWAYCTWWGEECDTGSINMESAYCSEWEPGDCICFSEWEYKCTNDETNWAFCIDHFWFECYVIPIK